MAERLYTDYPELYDALQSDWDYDRDVSFVAASLDRPGDNRLLDVGCGTGEHTRRFVVRGFDATAVDPHEGMLSVAREKCDAEFRRDALPDLDIEGEYDAVAAIRGVVNHLPPEDLRPALAALADRLTDGGVLVFDNSPLPGGGNRPGMDRGTTERGEYAYVAQHVPREDGRLDWNSVVFGPEGEVVVSSRAMTPFGDGEIADALVELGLDVETYGGYGRGDDRTVFVARA